MIREKFSSVDFGVVLIGLIALLSALTFWWAFSDQKAVTTIGAAGASSTVSSTLTLTNAAPLINSVTVNNAVSMTLVGNATTGISVNAQVFDVNGCADINNATATILLYRSSITSSTCLATQNNLNCYLATAFTATSSCAAGDTAINTTTTFGVYYFAQATDADSSFPNDTWLATVNARDVSLATATRDSAGVEMNTLLAINITTSSVNYGTMSPSSTSGFVNQTVAIQNTGNSSSSIGASGTALTFGSNVITTSSQHYASSTFLFGGAEQTLQETATTISGLTLLPRVSLVNDLGAWTNTTALPATLSLHNSVINNGYLYVVGGFSSAGATSTVIFAPINSTGSVGQWTNITALPNNLHNYALVTYNGYLYTLGGQTPGATSTVRYAQINSDGTIGSWIDTTALSGRLTGNAAIAYNGYIYVIGGQDQDGVVTSTVSFSAVNANGTLASWATTTPLPSTLFRHAVVVNNGRVYVVGGNDTATTGTSTVLYSSINTGGTLNSWTTTTPLPAPLRKLGAVVRNGYIYIIGGEDSAGVATSSVEYAAITTAGSITNWATTTIPSALKSFGIAQANGFLYLTGGSDGSATSTVLYGLINNGLSQRDTFWGLTIPTGRVTGTYSGANTFTASYVP